MSPRLFAASVLGLGAAVLAVLDGERGQVTSRTDDAVEVRLDSYAAFCMGPEPHREVQEGGAWATLDSRPWSGVVLDGDTLPYAMCCIVRCQRVETGQVDLRRYTEVRGAAGAMRAYTSAPVTAPLRATFHLYADPACAIPRTVTVKVEP